MEELIPSTPPTIQAYIKYFESKPLEERTTCYDIVRYWMDCNKDVVAVLEDHSGKELVTGRITRLRISVPNAYIIAGKVRYELERKTKYDRVAIMPSFTIEDKKGHYVGDFKTLDEAYALVKAGKKVRGVFTEDGNCKVWTAPITEVYLDAKLFVTESGTKYFISKY